MQLYQSLYYSVFHWYLSCTRVLSLVLIWLLTVWHLWWWHRGGGSSTCSVACNFSTLRTSCTGSIASPIWSDTSRQGLYRPILNAQIYIRINDELHVKPIQQLHVGLWLMAKKKRVKKKDNLKSIIDPWQMLQPVWVFIFCSMKLLRIKVFQAISQLKNNNKSIWVDVNVLCNLL